MCLYEFHSLILFYKLKKKSIKTNFTLFQLERVANVIKTLKHTYIEMKVNASRCYVIENGTIAI